MSLSYFLWPLFPVLINLFALFAWFSNPWMTASTQSSMMVSVYSLSLVKYRVCSYDLPDEGLDQINFSLHFSKALLVKLITYVEIFSIRLYHSFGSPIISLSGNYLCHSYIVSCCFASLKISVSMYNWSFVPLVPMQHPPILRKYPRLFSE